MSVAMHRVSSMRFSSEGSAVRVSMAEYQGWLEGYAPLLQAKIVEDWGAPEDATLMAAAGEFVIPVVRRGNVVVLPQPARGWGEDLDQLYHADDLAPHHQYVATYAWLRQDFGADAVVHLGTHGTLEWLDGKDIGLTSEDAPDALIADLPNLYVYNVDVVGEGLVARRRGMATLLDHMVPPFRKGGAVAGADFAQRERQRLPRQRAQQCGVGQCVSRADPRPGRRARYRQGPRP